MSINGPEELAGMRAAGAVVCLMLSAMKSAVRPGITTAELDEVGAGVMRQHGARSAPTLVYGFPGVNCISVNEEAVHGIPGTRSLREGDLVKLDVTVEKNGFMADAAVTVPVGKVSEERRRLAKCAERAFAKAMLVAPLQHRPYHRLCRGRSPARHHRNLCSGRLLRFAAHPGDRHSHGARLAARGHRPARPDFRR